MLRRPALASIVDRRQQIVLAAAAATGVLVGAAVAGYERLVTEVLLDAVVSHGVWLQAVAPGLGLAVAALALWWLPPRGVTPDTSDQYVRAFHDRQGRLDLRSVPARLSAGILTLGSGGALGLEGPSIYVGAAIGSGLQSRLRRFFSREDTKLLLVAGAAAGVAAVFKAPATGVVFALEVPYTDDVARRALIPALVASATSYLMFVSLIGTTPLFSLFGTGVGFGLADLGGAALVGVLAGGGARWFALLIRRAKAAGTRLAPGPRLAVAGAGLAALAVITHLVYEQPLSLGPGYDVFRWVNDADLALGLIAGLFAIRMAATLLTLGGGGAGGLFIPLAVQGILLGRLVAGVFDSTTSSLYPVIGIAAFLGAGYRTPIASVMFVAETTGRASYVVPALVAAAVSQLMMGRSSVSSAQQTVRGGHLERRFRLPISTALTTDVEPVPPDASVAELMWTHVVGRRERAVPVVDDGRYVGMCRIEEVSDLPRETWETTTVAEIMRTDLPLADPTWTLRDAVAAMEAADVDVLAVADAQGRWAGIVQTSEIVKLDEILEETGDDQAPA